MNRHTETWYDKSSTVLRGVGRHLAGEVGEEIGGTDLHRQTTSFVTLPRMRLTVCTTYGAVMTWGGGQAFQFLPRLS